jgi:hypothetical protein
MRMTYRSAWLDWQPTRDADTSRDSPRTDKTDRTSVSEGIVGFVSSSVDERGALSAAVMRLRQAGGSIGVAGDRVTIVEPTEVCVETRAAVDRLRRHESAAVRLLEALESVQLAGVRLRCDRNGQRIVAVPRGQDRARLLQALATLGYAIPIVLIDKDESLKVSTDRSPLD